MTDHDALLVRLDYIKSSVDGINTRLDALNGRTRECEQSIAVLNDRADRVAVEAKASGAKWGAGLGALLAALIAGLAQTFGAKQ